jgi:hypothetical protein
MTMGDGTTPNNGLLGTFLPINLFVTLDPFVMLE